MKFAIYYNHYNTLGHSTRVLGLVKAIKRDIPGSRILLLEGGRTPEILGLKTYARVRVIPHSMDKKGLFMEENRNIYKGMISSPAIDKMLKARRVMVRRALDRFKPDVFITEYFPLGQEFWTFELPSLLEYVKGELGCKIVGSAGYLSYTEGTHRHIRDFYDAVFVHSPRAFALAHVKYFSRPMALGLGAVLKDFKDRIHFTGFVSDRSGGAWQGASLRRLYTGRGFKKLVFVSRGGGIVNKEILVSSIMAARKKKDWFFTVCCGPATSRKDLVAYQGLARGMDNVRIIHALPADVFDQHLAAADLNVSMSGYNTSVKLMYLRKRSVLVPYASTEQRYRAELLREYIPAVYVQDKDVTVGRLCAAMDEALALPRPRKRVPAHWFDGAGQTAGMLACL